MSSLTYCVAAQWWSVVVAKDLCPLSEAVPLFTIYLYSWFFWQELRCENQVCKQVFKRAWVCVPIPTQRQLPTGDCILMSSDGCTDENWFVVSINLNGLMFLAQEISLLLPVLKIWFLLINAPNQSELSDFWMCFWKVKKPHNPTCKWCGLGLWLTNSLNQNNCLF